MITVRIFGLLRLKTGLCELHFEEGEIKTLKDVCRCIAEKNQGEEPIAEKEVLKCIVLLNGRAVRKPSTLLSAGDELVLLSPAGGG